MKNIKHRKEKHPLSTKPIIPKHKHISTPHHITNNDTSISSNSNDNSNSDNNNIHNTSNPFEVPQEKYIYNPFQIESPFNSTTLSPLNNNNNTFFKVSPTFSTTSSSSLSIQAAMLNNNNKPNRKKKRIHSFTNVDSFSPKNYYNKQCSFRRRKDGDDVVKKKKRFKKEKHVSFKESFVEVIEVQNWKELFWENEIDNCIENQKRFVNNKESRCKNGERNKNEKCTCKCIVY